VPVFHVLGDHWITFSNLRCDSNRIVVYDEAYSSVDTQVKDLVNSMFSADLDMQRNAQTNWKCRLWCICQSNCYNSFTWDQNCKIQSFFASIAFAAWELSIDRVSISLIDCCWWGGGGLFRIWSHRGTAEWDTWNIYVCCGCIQSLDNWTRQLDS